MKLYEFTLDLYKLYHENQIKINKYEYNVRETPKMYIFEGYPFRKTVYKDEINCFRGANIYLFEDDIEKVRNRFIDYFKSKIKNDEFSINLHKREIERNQNAIEILQEMEFSQPETESEELEQ